MQKAAHVSDITDTVDPVFPQTTNSQIYDSFRDNSDLLVLAVVDTCGRVLGLIERHSFNLKMASEYGRALFGNKSVTTMMDTCPLTVEAETPLRDFMQATLAERASELLRGFIVTRDGAYAGVGTTLSILKAMNDDLQDSLLQQREMVSDLIRLSAESERHQSFLNTIIDNIPAMVLVKDAHSRVKLINPAGEDMLGVKRSDVVGKTSHDIFPAEQADTFTRSDRRVLASGEAVMIEEEAIYNGVRQRTVQLKKTVLRGPDGAPDSILTLGIDLTEQKAAEARIAQLAHYDPLTGLGNRTLYTHEIEQALSRVQRHGHHLALHCLDLDRFKTVNDSFGHLAGDALLRQVGERLRLCVRKGDFIARMGGDEFAIIQNIERPEDARCLAERVIEVMKSPFDINGIRLEAGVSVGIALAPEDAADANNLLSRADLALYRVKSEGRNGWCFYHAEMDAVVQQRLEMEHELRTALSEQQFQLHFQPLLNLDSGEVVSFEALLRWHHPHRGMVSPGEFIPVAEDSGLIGPIGDWVLREACRQAAQWPTPWRIAVNISPLQFRDGSLPRLVKDALKASGLDPRRLELEITESVLLADEKHNLKILNTVRDMGVRIAMDDFGTGYSSLSYLRAFPFDKIKIDQSFVRDLPHDQNALSIIRAISDMAEALGVHITAEGVETEAQMEALKAMNCREAQGYLIGRPAAAIEAYAAVKVA
ncbi:EAL domain-containing protein [Asticcacaulis excentricus]|uniref:Diguanylate cyclase/phosphodiesterase with PAS/PAC sensor(S) n=1 Tax=Asticcacaulis excentricus (strain ATCC 15261 / DSM 4724 / KCTC 12464 / NCIMB 9791 / VKM B-1370 / CB 48) TaxID=573065 RepID=E8RTG5_ASTEC|nr:EAL domain-containing protein [Asticcacaulis excentricus]ADU14786.1 diguanylate cyclase/phosphodiesterase with PAS/PAC sensor(s) [Asticcacaulis excentricus CB 48]